MAQPEQQMPSLISPEQAQRIQRLEEVLLLKEQLKQLCDEEKPLRLAILTDMTKSKTNQIQVGEKRYAYRKKKCTINPKKLEVQERTAAALVYANKGAITAEQAQATVKEIYAPKEVTHVYVLTINNPSKKKSKAGQLEAEDSDGDDEGEMEAGDDEEEAQVSAPPPLRRQTKAGARSNKRKRN